MREHGANRIGQLGDLVEPLGDRGDTRFVQHQPVDECRRAAGLAGGGKVLGVGGENGRRRRAQSLRCGA